jgi:hypothetical protein
MILTKFEKSCGKNGKRPPSTVGILLVIEETRRRMTKRTAKSPRLLWDSHEEALTV